jgi:hypothetical protein
MNANTENTTEEKLDLVETIKQYVELEPDPSQPNAWMGICPFHKNAEQDGKTFFVLPDRKTFYKNGEYTCHICGHIGDAEKFIRMITGNLTSFDKYIKFAVEHHNEYIKQSKDHAKYMEAKIVDMIRFRLKHHHHLSGDDNGVIETKEYIQKLIDEGKNDIYHDLYQILEDLDRHYVIPPMYD